jgi:hypothetical protein
VNLARKVKYIYDPKGNKTEVILPYKKYQELIEELEDLQAIEAVKHEKPIPLSEVKKRLKKS